MGIIPHYRDQNQAAVRELANHFDKTVVIDVLADPMETLNQIAECELIISSSLHGLIVADAMGIPNRHVFFSDNVTGNGFKFRDYNSVFDRDGVLPSLPAENAIHMSADELFGGYRSKQSRISELQQKLMSAMKEMYTEF